MASSTPPPSSTNDCRILADAFPVLQFPSSPTNPLLCCTSNFTTDLNLAKLNAVYCKENRVVVVASNGRSIGSPIPPSIAGLDKLEQLYLNDAGLTGSIPREIGAITSLKSLSLANNYLGGSIPKELGNLVNLRYLNLRSNRLEGTIPEELGNFRNATDISISYNSLSGPVPNALADLALRKLQYL
ncbi:hypothetical protein HDU96_000456, partial [Phlyctochytrium bullatum]